MGANPAIIPRVKQEVISVLGSFRKLGETWFIKGFLALLALSFVTWGIGDYLVGGQQAEALRINESSLSGQDIDRAYSTARQLIERNFEGSLSAEQLLRAGLPAQVLGRLMQETLLLQGADMLDMAAPAKAVALQIQNNPLFFTDGRFNPNTYKRIVRSMGYTVAGYEQEQRDQMKLRMFAAVFTPPLVNDLLVQRRSQRAGTTADLQFVRLAPVSLAGVAAPLPDQLQAFYEQNRGRYVQPEQRSINVLTLALEDLPTPPLSNEQVRAFYEDNPTRFTTPERRKARHILLPDATSAQEIKESLAKGRDFAELAQEHSLDSASAKNGGSLGALTRAEVLPAFADTLFSLTPGEISAPVETALGVHIIRLDGITPATRQPLAEVRSQIEQELKTAAAEETYFNLLEDAEDRLAAGETLTEIGAALSLPVKTYAKISADQTQGLPPQVLQTAFTQGAGAQASNVSLDETHTAFVETADVTPAKTLPLAEVRTQAIKDWKQKQAQEKLKAQAQKLASIAEKEDLRQALAKMGIKAPVEEALDITRLPDQTRPWLTTDIRGQIFRRPVGTTFTSTEEDGSIVLARTTHFSVPEIGAEELGSLRAQIARKMGDELAGEFLGYELAQADVSYNLPQLRLIFGDGFNASQIPASTWENSL
jgi:peptidyl-prolyl cis-trans isomerase D